jgi:uncharacterized membrane protein YgdD (TMEM256/DUF423 family)
MSEGKLIRIAAVITGVAVMCGAFGAHALRDVVSAERLAVWEKAVLYQLVHGVALLALGVFTAGGARENAAALVQAAKVMCFGVVVFSGSLYVLVLTDTGWLGAITPVGGMALIASWGMVAFGKWR